VNGEPCSTYIGEDGAGHYVKMVHNGIEYGDMQLIGEAYHLLKDVLDLNTDQLHDMFTEWNSITESVFARFISAMKEERVDASKMLNGPAASNHDGDPGLKNLFLDGYFSGIAGNYQEAWRKVVSIAVTRGIPVPAFASASA
jgi:6-phosphogluconate dehydrogenase